MTFLFTTSSADLVCILDNDTLQQIFTPTSPVRVSVTETKKATKFAVEDGSSRSDHVTTDPIEISFDLFIDDENARNSYEEIKQSWADNRLVTVQTKVSSYPNMLITDIPHDETTDTHGAILMPIKMQEWRTYQPQFVTLPISKVKNPAQSSTVDAGQKQTSETTPATQRKASTLYKVFN